jgi:hypothetical protein
VLTKTIGTLKTRRSNASQPNKTKDAGGSGDEEGGESAAGRAARKAAKKAQRAAKRAEAREKAKEGNDGDKEE